MLHEEGEFHVHMYEIEEVRTCSFSSRMTAYESSLLPSRNLHN